MRDKNFHIWKKYKESKDPKLKEEIIIKYIYLVKYVASRMANKLPGYVDLNDLISAGIMGFLSAIDCFDINRDVDFSTYATVRIRGSILDELRELDWVPRFVRRKAKLVEKAMNYLEQKLKRTPTDFEIAQNLNVSLEEYHNILGEVSGNNLLSLDIDWKKGSSDDNNSLNQYIKDVRGNDPLTNLVIKKRKEILGKVINSLPLQEKLVLSLYYYDELTMKEIGKIMDVTESRVSQIHSSAILRMRARLKRTNLAFEDLYAEPPGEKVISESLAMN